MDGVIRLPAITECQVSGDFDESKGKSWIELAFQGIIIREYLPELHGLSDDERHEVMSIVANKARLRLAIALRAKHRREKYMKLVQNGGL